MKLTFTGKEIIAGDAEAEGVLARGFFGKAKGGKLLLSPEEALYLVDNRGAECNDEKGKAIQFNSLASHFSRSPKLLARYLVFKDWRERGLIAKDAKEILGKFSRSAAVSYPSAAPALPHASAQGIFFPQDMLTTIDSPEGKTLYEEGWFGQFGTYKAAHKGTVTKLDAFETLYLLRKGILSIPHSNFKKILSHCGRQIRYFSDMYEVYEDWREKGFVIKTGFKFGSHFRVYFPGASPTKGAEWLHSRHVLHVFPRRSKLLISEWARAIRLAHSVKKTFILAVPGKRAKSARTCDFALYHRKGTECENPRTGEPSFLALALTEDEYLGGVEFAQALEECSERGLELVIAIADRETSVTYYLIKKVGLAGSKFDYFEIQWLNP
ncbi:MAG: tRNA-intron lyase [Candidatus ainarchaeum sp.]|nr:tRNA-intron lyase [Candidatus ainarchaeum sp.]